MCQHLRSTNLDSKIVEMKQNLQLSIRPDGVGSGAEAYATQPRRFNS